MKKTIFVMLLLIFHAGIILHASNSIPLFDAIKKKMVSVKIKGRGYTSDNSSAHYGKCVSLKIRNLTSQPLNVNMEAGRRLKCVYDSVQDMLVSRSDMYALAPNASGDFTISAFCSQKHDRAPSESSIFDISSMSEGYLYELAVLIESLACFDNTGQQAVWVLTDSISPNNISGADAAKVKKLKDFVTFAMAHGTPEKQYGFTYDYSFPNKSNSGFIIKGEVNWNMPYTSFVTISVYDNQNTKIATIFAEKPYKPGYQTYTYDLANTTFKEGELYWLRVEGCGKCLKELAIKME